METVKKVLKRKCFIPKKQRNLDASTLGASEPIRLFLRKICIKELAKRVNRERTYINRIEKGETDLQLSSFIRIASALGGNASP